MFLIKPVYTQAEVKNKFDRAKRIQQRWVYSGVVFVLLFMSVPWVMGSFFLENFAKLGEWLGAGGEVGEAELDSYIYGYIGIAIILMLVFCFIADRYGMRVLRCEHCEKMIPRHKRESVCDFGICPFCEGRIVSDVGGED